MPQEATALLPNSGITAKRDFISTTAAVGGDAGTQDDAFSQALRESQTTLDELASTKESARELLPDDGNQLPLEQISIVFSDGEIPDDLQVDSAVLIQDGKAPVLPEKLSIQNQEAVQADNADPGLDKPGVYSIDSQLKQRLENTQTVEVATHDEVAGRQSSVLTKDSLQVARDSADKLFIEQHTSQISKTVEPMGKDKLTDDSFLSKMALDATKTFMNVSSIASAENTQPILPLSSGQSLTLQSSDKVLSALTIDSPLQSREWKEEVGDRVRWLISQKLHSAELKINPPQLGSVDIRINVQNEQVTIQFNTANALVKDALEESLPRLREILSSSGLDLVDADVAQHSDKGGSHAENDAEDADSKYMQDNKLSQHDEHEINIESDTILKKGIIDMYA